MKKSLKLLASIALVTFFVNISSVASANNNLIGVIDTQKIIQQSQLYSELRKAETELQTLQANFQKEYMARMQKMEEAYKQKKSPTELAKLQKQYENELKAKQQSAQKTLQGKQSNLERMRVQLRQKVEVAIKNIAQKKKITYVIDKQSMYFGGLDITNDVLSQIK